MKLIIIQGGAATGKSTLAKILEEKLGVSTFLKDAYKETVSDQSKKKLGPIGLLELEEQSYEAIYKAAKEAIKRDESLIIEGNFLPSRREKLKELIKPNCVVIEFYCYADGPVMLKRFIQRKENGDRHGVHTDRLWYGVVFLEALCAQLGWRWYRPLRLSNNLMKVNTSNPKSVDYQSIVGFINNA